MDIFFWIAIFLLISFFLAYYNTPEKKGQRGEQQVAERLSNLGGDYTIFNDVILKTDKGSTQIDHVVISRYGIFVIETKNYKGWIFGDYNSQEWKQTFKTESHFFKNPIKQNWGHIYALSSVLKIDKSKFINIVAFSSQTDLHIRAETPVVYIRNINNTIAGYHDVILTDSQVRELENTIYNSIARGEHIHEEHATSIYTKVREEKESIKNGICPKCKGKLILRDGKYGRFYGCSNYPKCKYTLNTK